MKPIPEDIPKQFSGAPSGRSRRLPSTTRPPGTAYSRRLVLHGREEALSTPGGSLGDAKARDCGFGTDKTACVYLFQHELCNFYELQLLMSAGSALTDGS